MSDSVTTTVDVAVAPEVAFDVFMREIDAWYQVDKDTLPDITRTAAIRFEPHLGGRLFDVHDITSGEGRELGRITGWEPGRRLAFTDNEGTEVEVAFESSARGTRVTLTHRGLDRVTTRRAAQLRRKGWAALVPFYRDHVAPNARPTALAVAFVAGFAALGCGTWLTEVLARDQSSWVSASIWIVWIVLAWAGLIALVHAQRSVARRWLASWWQYGRTLAFVLALVASGLLIAGLRRVIADGEDALFALASPVTLLMVLWLGATRGPAAEWNARRRPASVKSRESPHRLSSLVPPTIRSFLSRHESFRVSLLLVAVIAVGNGIASLGEQVARPVILALFAYLAVRFFRSAAERRRARCRKQTLGFDPDYYLAVERRVSEHGVRPELLIHRPSRHPEYSGWHAFASDQDAGSNDLITWSVEDLLDHSPEAALPLREGHGKWRWDAARHAYQPI